MSLANSGPGQRHAAAHPPHQRTCNFLSAVLFFRLPAKAPLPAKASRARTPGIQLGCSNKPRCVAKLFTHQLLSRPPTACSFSRLRHFLLGLDSLTPPSPRPIPRLWLPLLASDHLPVLGRLSFTSNLKAHHPHSRPPISLPTTEPQLLLYMTRPSSFHQPTSLVCLSAASTGVRLRRLPVFPHTRRGSPQTLAPVCLHLKRPGPMRLSDTP